MTRADRLLLFIALCTLPLLYAQLWQADGPASHLRVQAGNAAPVETPLAADRTLHVHGPLGDSVIEVSRGRARFISSPCAGQACVHSGWLQTAGEVAACLPNRISLQIVGDQPRFDSINF